MQDREIDNRLKAGLRRKISIAARRLAARGVKSFIQCATGAGPPSFALRKMRASGTEAAEINASTQNTSM
jgi:hypothetical protein